jgi:hypothetical protein
MGRLSKVLVFLIASGIWATASAGTVHQGVKKSAGPIGADAAASVTFGASSFGSATSGTTITAGTVTIGSESGRYLLWLIGNRRNAAQNVSTNTFNSLPSVYDDDGNGTFIHAEAHHQTAPSTGISVATTTASAAVTGMGVSTMYFYNVNQSSAMRSFGNASSDTATSINITLPTVAGDMCAALYVRSTPVALTPDAGETSVVQFDVGVEFTHMATYKAASGTSVTMGASWTGSNRIRMEMVCLKP